MRGGGAWTIEGEHTRTPPDGKAADVAKKLLIERGGKAKLVLADNAITATQLACFRKVRRDLELRAWRILSSNFVKFILTIIHISLETLTHKLSSR